MKMKQCNVLAIAFLLLLSLSACGRQPETALIPERPHVLESASAEPPSGSEESEHESAMTDISITVGDSVFSVKLYDNDTTAAFVSRLPMRLHMSELNGNEKYYYFPYSLPADSQQVGSVRTGDLMLYGSDCLVLFYQSFTTPYSYTKIGYIENATGLADSLGRGNVDVVFEKIQSVGPPYSPME